MYADLNRSVLSGDRKVPIVSADLADGDSCRLLYTCTVYSVNIECEFLLCVFSLEHGRLKFLDSSASCLRSTLK